MARRRQAPAKPTAADVAAAAPAAPAADVAAHRTATPLELCEGRISALRADLRAAQQRYDDASRRIPALEQERGAADKAAVRAIQRAAAARGAARAAIVEAEGLLAHHEQRRRNLLADVGRAVHHGQ